AMNDPKKSVSDDRNTQNPSFQVFSPVAVGGWSACASVCAMVSSSREAGPAPGPEARAGCLPAVLCVPVRGPVRLNARNPPFALGPGPTAPGPFRLRRLVRPVHHANERPRDPDQRLPPRGRHEQDAGQGDTDRREDRPVRVRRHVHRLGLAARVLLDLLRLDPERLASVRGRGVGPGAPRAACSRCAASTASGSRRCTVGIFAKWYWRGGDSVAHSSVAACHGFGPAFWPRFRLRITFVKSMITPIAWMNAPAVTSWFSPSRLRSAP